MTPIPDHQTDCTLEFKKKTAPLGAKNWISPKSAKSADLHPKSEKFDYTRNTGIKKNTFLVVIPVTLLSPQVRSKKTPLGFEKRGSQKKSPSKFGNFSLTFINTFEKN